MTHSTKTLALLLAAIAQPVLADDTIFKGDCERARIVQAERTVDRLMPYPTYYGTQRVEFANDSCGRDTFIDFALRQSQRSASKVVYDLTRVDLLYGTAGGCAQTQVHFNDMVGTVTFTTGLRQNGSICEVYIWSDWTMRQTGSSWTGTLANRVVALNEYSFVVAQGTTAPGQYATPLTFVGVR